MSPLSSPAAQSLSALPSYKGVSTLEVEVSLPARVDVPTVTGSLGCTLNCGIAEPLQMHQLDLAVTLEC